MKKRAVLTLELPGQLPREFLVFPFGAVETVKGRFLFDRAGAEQLMAAWLDYGNRLSIDYEHQALEPVSNGPVPAAGWFDLELRADGLWAVNVDWTPRAAEMLANREYRYISPAFFADENGRIVELINIALTNIPATKRMQPLVARRDGNPTQEAKNMEKHETLLARLSALTGREQPDQIEAVILAWREAHTQVEALSRELEALKTERAREQQERLIERAQAEGKLTPAMLGWARSLSVEALEAYLSVAPRILNTSNTSEPMRTNKSWAEMSGPERAELHAQNPEEYRRLRREALGY